MHAEGIVDAMQGGRRQDEQEDIKSHGGKEVFRRRRLLQEVDDQPADDDGPAYVQTDAPDGADQIYRHVQACVGIALEVDERLADAERQQLTKLLGDADSDGERDHVTPKRELDRRERISSADQHQEGEDGRNEHRAFALLETTQGANHAMGRGPSDDRALAVAFGDIAVGRATDGLRREGHAEADEQGH